MADEVFEGSIFIEAPPEEVFKYFTEAEALASWAHYLPRHGAEAAPECC